MGAARVSYLGRPLWPWDAPTAATQQCEPSGIPGGDPSSTGPIAAAKAPSTSFCCHCFFLLIFLLPQISQLSLSRFPRAESCPAPAQPAAPALTTETFSGTWPSPPTSLISPSYPALAALCASGSRPTLRLPREPHSHTSPLHPAEEPCSSFRLPPLPLPRSFPGSVDPNTAGAEGQADHTGLAHNPQNRGLSSGSWWDSG